MWTAGYAGARLTAQARSPMDKPGKTPCVSPTLPTGRRLPTSFTALPQHQGLNLIPGKVKPFSRRRALAYSSRNLSKQPGPPQNGRYHTQDVNPDGRAWHRIEVAPAPIMTGHL